MHCAPCIHYHSIIILTSFVYNVSAAAMTTVTPPRSRTPLPSRASARNLTAVTTPWLPCTVTMAAELSLSERASQLREQFAPLPMDKVVAAWADIYKNPPATYYGHTLPKDCKPFLSQYAVNVGSIAGAPRTSFAHPSRVRACRSPHHVVHTDGSPRPALEG